MVSLALPAITQIRAWLDAVPDPEIPVISVVDLGIVRDVSWNQSAQGDECVVTITPTYSGCPAMAVIAQSIQQALHSHGIAQVALKVQLSPAWTTDWLSAKGRQALQAYGIAPPAQQVIDISGISRKSARAPQVACPHCGAAQTSRTSEFGSTPCKALYRCDACLEPFDYFKCH